jgi:hypothetical protein
MHRVQAAHKAPAEKCCGSDAAASATDPEFLAFQCQWLYEYETKPTTSAISARRRYEPTLTLWSNRQPHSNRE